MEERRETSVHEKLRKNKEERRGRWPTRTVSSGLSDEKEES